MSVSASVHTAAPQVRDSFLTMPLLSASVHMAAPQVKDSFFVNIAGKEYEIPYDDWYITKVRFYTYTYHIYVYNEVKKIAEDACSGC